MALGVNMHDVVRPIINYMHPDQLCTLYLSEGQSVLGDGDSLPKYAEGVPVRIQIQSESTTALYYSNNVGKEEIVRKFYLYATNTLQKKIASIVREVERNGDFVQLPDGTWWLVTASIKDFAVSGWCSTRAVRQNLAPDFSGSDWYTEGDGNG